MTTTTNAADLETLAVSYLCAVDSWEWTREHAPESREAFDRMWAMADAREALAAAVGHDMGAFRAAVRRASELAD